MVVVDDDVAGATAAGLVVEDVAAPAVVVVDVPVVAGAPLVHAAASRASTPTVRSNFTRPDYGLGGDAASFPPGRSLANP